MIALAIPMLSQKKLNTYGVESPCERLPGVGSFLANPGLSKEQLVPSCEMRTIVVTIMLIIKRQMICVILACKMTLFIIPY